MPTVEVNKSLSGLDNGIYLVDALIACNLVTSKSQARTLIEQGGISVNDLKTTDSKYVIDFADFKDNFVVIKKGKKIFIKLVLN